MRLAGILLICPHHREYRMYGSTKQLSATVTNASHLLAGDAVIRITSQSKLNIPTVKVNFQVKYTVSVSRRPNFPFAHCHQATPTQKDNNSSSEVKSSLHFDSLAATRKRSLSIITSQP